MINSDDAFQLAKEKYDDQGKMGRPIPMMIKQA